jgi:plasmid stabilization system protein ParE
VKVVISGEATADLARLREFLADRNPAAAQRATTTIAQGIDSLAAYPDRATPSDAEGLRELIVPFGRSAYVIRFMHDLQQEEIVIVRIWHGRETRP